MDTCTHCYSLKKVSSSEHCPESEAFEDQCISCGKDILVVLDWFRCMNDGCDGKWWVRQSKDTVSIDMLKCDSCVEKRLKALERARYYESGTPPSDFDESYCGERWDDDY